MGIIILILLSVSLALNLKRSLFNRLIGKTRDYERLKYDYEELGRKNIKLITDNFALEDSVNETAALYGITRDICKSLDEEEIFDLFRERINKYVKVEDCKFLKQGNDISGFKDYTVLPLAIKKSNVGYLVSKGVKEIDREKFGILAQQFLFCIKRALLYRKVQEVTITDSLTHVFNRRYFTLRFNEELERSKRLNYKFAFLMLDIDHFKDCNDSYGHLVGDVILREVTLALKENMRQIDFVGRYGGEEFSIILTDTDKEQAQFAAERFRQAVASRKIRAYDENLKVTISIGISVFPDDAEDEQRLIDKADQALYRAKQAGRNRVSV